MVASVISDAFYLIGFNASSHGLTDILATYLERFEAVTCEYAASTLSKHKLLLALLERIPTGGCLGK